MGYVIEISESKVGKLSEHIEKGLRHIGKAMQCVDEWMEGEGYGERGSMGDRSRGGMRDDSSYGNRYGGMGYSHPYGERDDDDWEDDDEYRPGLGERRGRSRRTGRYVRR